MKLNYRGKQYTFWGREILPTSGGKVTNEINAFDTESCRTASGWECQLISYSHPGGELHKFLDPGVVPLYELLKLIFSINPLAKEEKRKDWPVYYIYAHNLQYDWSQLIKNSPMLYELSRTGQVVKPLNFLLGKYLIKMVRGVFQGSSPFITMEIERGDSGAVVELRDTFGFYKSSLASLARTMGIPEKLKSENLGQIDFRTIGDNVPAKKEFIEYAQRDAYITRMVAEKIRELHNLFDFKKLKVSGPAFAASALVAEIPDGQALLTDKGNKVALQLALDAYRGGRTGGIYHGPVQKVWVYDIHSSYPAAMWSLPSFSTLTEVMRRVAATDKPIPYKWAMAMLKEYPACLCRITGEETDHHYPALVTTLPDGKLSPVFGKFENLATTGPEVLAGIVAGGLKDIVFNELVVYFDRKGAVSPFKNFVEKAYKIKERSPKDSPEYTAAKLSLNSGYGKLIESHQGVKGSLIENVAVFICDPKQGEVAEKVEREQAQMYFRMYLDALDSGKPPGATISKYQRDMIEAGFFKAGRWVPINELELTENDFGYYVCPPAAALITGIARARLYLGIKYTGALYWDTDSLFTHKKPLEVAAILEAIPEDATPKGVIPVRFGPDLGEFGVDLPESSGHLSGVKRYYLTYTPVYKPFDYMTKKKYASHGLPNLEKKKVFWALEALSTGQNFKYREQPSPLGVKTASLEMAGAFLDDEELSQVESNFFLDLRLTWVPTGYHDEHDILGFGPWRGTVKKYQDLMDWYEGTELEKYTKKLRAKNKKQQENEKKKFRAAVLALGGVNDGSYENMPRWAKRKNGQPLDTMVGELAGMGYPVECAEDVYSLIINYF